MSFDCYDPHHGHIVGPGRYWTDGFGLLVKDIRHRCAGQAPVVLAGEHCGEAWVAHLDSMLTLDASRERFWKGPFGGAWEVIPFFPAVYHSCSVCFGNYGTLVRPPYDECWPPEKAPPEQLTLLDRKYARQFYLEHARTFVWGQQPMLANYRPPLLRERPEEMDYVARLVSVRLRALKYLLDGTWLRPPRLDAPQRDVTFAQTSIYSPLGESVKPCPAVLAGAWRAPDGDVAIALASIDDQNLSLRIPVDVRAYGLGDRSAVYRIDAAGRHRIGSLHRRDPVLQVELPPRALWGLEFSKER
jgi:hypothetical protein